jgi:hypothetical protein
MPVDDRRLGGLDDPERREEWFGAGAVMDSAPTCGVGAGACVGAEGFPFALGEAFGRAHGTSKWALTGVNGRPARPRPASG